MCRGKVKLECCKHSAWFIRLKARLCLFGQWCQTISVISCFRKFFACQNFTHQIFKFLCETSNDNFRVSNKETEININLMEQGTCSKFLESKNKSSKYVPGMNLKQTQLKVVSPFFPKEFSDIVHWETPHDHKIIKFIAEFTLAFSGISLPHNPYKTYCFVTIIYRHLSRAHLNWNSGICWRKFM